MLKRGVGFSLFAFVLSACEPSNQGYAPSQPIQYSHALHAGAMQISCEYCHFGASTSRHAGIPPAAICMNCHKQVLPNHAEIVKVREALAKNQPIAWTRVNFLPDHVYFNHAIHINAQLSCQTCHGPVETMGRVEQWAPLTMGFCLDCHRTQQNPDGAPIQGGPLTDCGVCHH